MRWEMGSVMPADIRYNMSELESQWFNTYSKVFAEYMSKLGDHGGLGKLLHALIFFFFAAATIHCFILIYSRFDTRFETSKVNLHSCAMYKNIRRI